MREQDGLSAPDGEKIITAKKSQSCLHTQLNLSSSTEDAGENMFYMLLT